MVDRRSKVVHVESVTEKLGALAMDLLDRCV